MYVKKKVPVDLKAGTYFDGACLTEGTTVELNACDPMAQCLLDPQPLPCTFGDVEPSPELQKLCDLLAVSETIAECLEIIKDQPVAAFANDGFRSGKCTPDGQPIFICKHTDNVTGEITWESLAYIDGAVVPYDGDCIDCNKQYNFINGYVADTESQYCGYPIYECEGLFWALDTNLCEYIEIDKTMPITYGAPTTPATKPECINLTYELCNQGEAVETVTGAEIVAQALAGAAANSVTWPNGDDIVATAEAGETVSAGPFIAATAGVPIKLDDGTIHEVSCDYGGICVYPNAGTNGDALSGGGTAPIGPNDSVDVDPGAGGSGCITICRDIDKSGQVVVAAAK